MSSILYLNFKFYKMNFNFNSAEQKAPFLFYIIISVMFYLLFEFHICISQNEGCLLW